MEIQYKESKNGCVVTLLAQSDKDKEFIKSILTIFEGIKNKTHIDGDIDAGSVLELTINKSVIHTCDLDNRYQYPDTIEDLGFLFCNNGYSFKEKDRDYDTKH